MQNGNRDIRTTLLKPYVRCDFRSQLLFHVPRMLGLANLVWQRKADIHSLVTPTALSPDKDREDYVETACLPNFRGADIAPVNAQMITDQSLDIGLYGLPTRPRTSSAAPGSVAGPARFHPPLAHLRGSFALEELRGRPLRQSRMLYTTICPCSRGCPHTARWRECSWSTLTNTSPTNLGKLILDSDTCWRFEVYMQ